MTIRRRISSSRSTLLYLPVALILFTALIVMGVSVFLKIMVIEVEGATRYTKEEIIVVSGISAGDNIMFLDTDSAARRIQNAYAYINEVVIEPVPPYSVLITVTESNAVAYLEYQNNILLIDTAGKVLNRVESIPRGLIEVRGLTKFEAEVGGVLRPVAGNDTQVRSVGEVLAAFDRTGIMNDVSYLDVTHISKIIFGYMGRFKVLLGESKNADFRLHTLPVWGMNLLEQISAGVTGTLDISDPSGYRSWNPDY